MKSIMKFQPAFAVVPFDRKTESDELWKVQFGQQSTIALPACHIAQTDPNQCFWFFFRNQIGLLGEFDSRAI